MLSVPKKIMDTIDSYIAALKQNNIPLKHAILFGSYAKGNPGEWSDIDIALVSDIFEGNRIVDKDKIRRITLSISTDIEVIPFSTDDFHPENPLAKEILETGIKLI